MRTSNDLTISNCRIAGTLVVNCPGIKVTVSGNVLLEPSSRDYPALIVVGGLAMNNTSVGQTLS